MRLGKIESRQRALSALMEGELPASRGKRRWVPIVLSSAGALALGLFLLNWWDGRHWLTTAGRVTARQLDVKAEARGRVTAVRVAAGDRVTKGQPLMSLEDPASSAELQRVEARHLEARTRIDPGVKAALTAAAQTEAELARQRERKAHLVADRAALEAGHARAAAERGQKLFLLRALTRPEWEALERVARGAEGEHLIGRQAWVESEAAAAASQAALRKEELRLSAEEAKVHAELRALEAERESLLRAIRRLEIVAPRDGVVTWLGARPDDVVEPGAPLLTLLDPNDVSVEVYVRGSDVQDLEDGQSAWLEADSLPGPVEGRLSLYAAPALGVPPEVRSPSDVSDSYRPLKVVIPGKSASLLRPEMQVDVRLPRRAGR